MIEYDEPIMKEQYQNNYFLYKPKKGKHYKLNRRLAPLAISQTSILTKPRIQNKAQTSRNTIDYFIQFSQKYKNQLQRIELPILSMNDKKRADCKSSKQELDKSKTKKEDSEISIREFKLHDKDLNKNIQELRLRTHSEVKREDKYKTIQYSQPHFKVKPSTRQANYLRAKIKFSSDRNNSQELFTFYPRHPTCHNEMINQFSIN